MKRSTHLRPVKTEAPAGFAPAFVAAVLDYALAAPGAPPVFAIAGLQGSGKSTLAAQLDSACRARGRSAVVLSIDDFYLDHDEREHLGRTVHPLLATRGPPGSHDVDLACRTLDALRALPAGGPVRLPRFDKLDDRRLPAGQWPVVTHRPDLIVFEGWCLCVPPEAESGLVEPLNALEREQDPDLTWRRHVNRALACYGPLWARLDRLLFLQGPGFGLVPDWRWEQECALQAANPGRQAMTRKQVERFVQFFERISRQALRTLPTLADRVVRIDEARRPLDELKP
ncbi:MAG: kinase [Rehaibacterium terrae]|uniref:kinase n=1 Tax=Rehaibacterium terrae TaxID=1341696 RepID=UPI00391A4CDD